MLKFNLFFILLILPTCLVASSISVSPLMIKLESDPGKTLPFEFSVTARKSMKIQLTLSDMKQLDTGHMGFVESGDNDIASITDWVSLKKNTLSVRKGDSITVPGELKIPPRSAGAYQIAIIIEEAKDESNKGGISVNVRYALILNITVKEKRRKTRLKTHFDDLVLIEEDNRLKVKATFSNLSASKGLFVSELQVRNNKRKIIDRITLKTLSAWQQETSGSEVIAKSTVTVFGFLNIPLKPGIYEFKTKNRFSGRNQPGYKKMMPYPSLEQLPDVMALESPEKETPLSEPSPEATSENKSTDKQAPP